MKRTREPSGEYHGLWPPRPAIAGRIVWRPLPSGRIASIVPSGVLNVIQRLSGDHVGCSTYPVGITRDALRPGDFNGAVVGIRASGTAERTFAALGGRSRAFAADNTYDGLDLVEQDLETLSGAEGLPACAA